MHRRSLNVDLPARVRRRSHLARLVTLATALPVVLSACTSAGHGGLAPSTSPSAVGSVRSDDANSPASSADSGAGASTAPSTIAASATALPSATRSASGTVPSTTTAVTSQSATATANASAPRFSSATTTVTAAQLGASWHTGCPVAPTQLRQISLTYWGFDGSAHTGTIVVNASVVTSVVKVFATLYAERFPIRRMEPVSNFGGSDDASMAVDNTSGFNCRNAVTQGPPVWSAHAYGKAIDVNTIENPYLEGGKVLPPEGAAYAKRTPYRPGMAVPGGQLVKAFAAVGWLWGGRWTGSPDYQHFSSTGG